MQYYMGTIPVHIVESSEELERLTDRSSDTAVVRRLTCLRLYRLLVLKGEPDPIERVADALRANVKTIDGWLRVYQRLGLEGLVGFGSLSPSIDGSAVASASAKERGGAEAAPNRPPAERSSRNPAGGVGRINLDRIMASVSDTSEALRMWKGVGPTGDAATPDSLRSEESPEARQSDRIPPRRKPASVELRTPSECSVPSRVPESRVASSQDPEAGGSPDPSGPPSTPGPTESPAEFPEASAPDQRPPDPIEGARILVAETDEMIRSVIRHRLERKGAMVTEASDGMEAVSVLEADEFDLVVIAASLPGLDGFEVVRWLRTDERHSYLPVMMLEWPGDPSMMPRAFEIGADDFLRKPFSPVELIARLKRMLSRDSRDGSAGGSP